ncbi:MAG: T9SS type A sorting domain-containing protein, partial [Lewinella sp.]|nr:T9SS type A sorting domain-containing protein [Lewinella sp.]
APGADGPTPTFAPDLLPDVPPLHQLFFTLDMNCDGRPDWVTGEALNSAAELQLVVYVRQGDDLSFRRRVPRLLDGETAELRLHAFDLPALSDINRDGAPDLLYIPLGGTHIQYYEQVAGSCDSLHFTLADGCWGEVTYTLDSDFQLGTCSDGFLPLAGCAGSVMVAPDLDEDGDSDLYFTGLYDLVIRQLRNTGDSLYATLTEQSTDWLPEPQGMPEYPAPYWLDWAGNGQPELVVASNRLYASGAGATTDPILRYRQNPEGQWQLQEANFLRNGMIDAGFRSSPAVADIDGDGLQDIVLGYNATHPVFGYSAGLSWYRNTGTAEQPAFSWMTDDLGGLQAQALKSVYPAFGDLDGDGRPELVTGLENGSMVVWSTSLLPDGPLQPVFPNPLDGISVSGLAHPQLADLNGDERLDLICGARDGTTTVWENTGTANEPSFSLLLDTLGGIAPTAFLQENSPWLSPGPGGLWTLYNAERDGRIHVYEGALGAPFAPLDTALAGIDVGERATLCRADLDGDGWPELLLGNMRGGLEIYRSEAVTNITNTPIKEVFTVYPNPVRDRHIQIRWPAPPPNLNSLRLYDQAGREISHRPLSGTGPDWSLVLPANLPTGMYWLEAQAGYERYGVKLILL